MNSLTTVRRVPAARLRRPPASPALLAAFAIAAAGCDRSEPNSPTAPGGVVSQPVPAATANPATNDARAGTSSPETTDAPQIVFDRVTHDFGRILDVEVHETSFTFTNGGGEDLVIDRVSTSPGVIVDPPIDGMVVPPGEMGVVEVRFEPMAYGPHAKVVDLHSNTAPTGFTRLTLSADVQALVSPTPRYMTFGTRPHGEEQRFTVSLKCDRGPFEIESLKTTNTHLSADVTPSGPGLQERTLEIFIDDEAPWGSFGGWVQLDSLVSVEGRAEPLRHQLRIPVQGALLGALVPNPLTIRVTTNTGEVWRSRTVLHHREGRPFTLISAEPAGGSVQEANVEFEENEDGGWEITMSGIAPPEPGTIQGAVAIVTDVSDEGELAIPVYIQVRGSADR